MQLKTSIKHLQINKANNAMFIAVAVASIITVFSLFSAKALLSKSSYQHKVLKQRSDAIDKLKVNVTAANTLKEQYDAFEKQNPNIIGGIGGDDIAAGIARSGGSGVVQLDGKPVTLGNQDGDNAKVILDALPSSYDFPALISSIEKIANLDNIPLESIAGTDDPNDSGTASSSAPTSTVSGAKAISFSLGSQIDYATTKTLINDLERSIRPIDVRTFSISGNGAKLNLNIAATTYYQSPLKLEISEKEVR